MNQSHYHKQQSEATRRSSFAQTVASRTRRHKKFAAVIKTTTDYRGKYTVSRKIIHQFNFCSISVILHQQNFDRLVHIHKVAGPHTSGEVVKSVHSLFSVYSSARNSVQIGLHLTEIEQNNIFSEPKCTIT